MKFLVNENCIACGLCVSTCPEVFEMNDDGFAQATNKEVDEATEVEATVAMESCPVDAIERK